MAYDARSGGVYILINGDASPLERKLEQVRQKISLTAKNIEGEVQGIFSRFDISNLAQKSLRSMATIQTSVRALGTDMSKHQREWEKYAKEIGLADNQAKKFAQTINSSLQAKSIKDIEQSLRNLQRQTGMTNAEVMKLAQEMGAAGVAAKKAFSELGIRSSDQIKRQITDIKAAFDQLKSSGTASAQDIARAQSAMQGKIKQLNAELKGTATAAGSAYNGLKNMAAAVVSITALTASVRSLIDAMVKLDSLKVSYASIFGGEAGGAAQLSYVYEVAQKLGLEFNSAAESAKGFFAASKGTTLEKDMNRIFEGVSEAATALHLSSEEVQGIFLALSQMVSKGKVSMEEMRQQLGERLPGAFKTAAEAMGMTTQELEKLISSGKMTAEELLPKMANAFHEKWGAAAQEASKSVQSALNRLSADWTLFKANLLDSDTVRAGIEGIHSSLKGLESVIKALSNNKEIISAVLTGATTAAGVAMIAKYSTSIAALGTTLGALAAQAKAAAAALGTFLVANPWVAVAAAIGTASAALVYFTEKANAAEQAQKALTSAQEAAISMNKLLADQGRATLQQAEQELKSAQEQYQSMVTQNENLLQSLSDSLHYEIIDMQKVRAATDDYTTALEELALQTAKTGDFEALERGIRSIEAQAKIAGKETNTFKEYVEQLKAVCSTGVKLHVEMTGYRNVISKLINLVRAKMQLGDTFDPTQQKREQDALKGQIANIPNMWGGTKQGKISANNNLKAQYESLQKILRNPEKLRELGISADDAKEKLSMLGDLIKDADDKNEGLLKSLNKTSGSASKAANAQVDYAKEVANTRDHIAALQKQLELDKSDDYGKAKIAIEREYNKKLNDTNASIEKRVRAKGGISAAQAEELKKLKAEELSLEKNIKLIEAKDKATEKQLSHLQEQLSFYDELAQMSGNYTTSMELQNQIIDIQAQKYRDLKTIPEELIQEWAKWKKLEASTNPFDGALRGLKKFAAEYGNSAKQWENITYNFAKGFEQNIHDMFDEFIDTGKISFDSMADLFKNLLKQMAYQALVQPIVLSVVNGVTGAVMGTGTAAAGTGIAGAGQSASGLLTGAATSLVQNAVMAKVGGGLMNAAGGFLNSTAASLFPSTFAPTTAAASVNTAANAASLVTGGAANLPTQTATSVLGSGWTMGAGLVGGLLGSQVIVPALGIKEGTGTSVGGMLGGAGGTLGGALLGAQFGSVGGPIGAGIGALVGTVLGSLGGSLFGGGYEDEPGYYINTYTDLTRAEGLAGYKEGTAIQNHRWDSFSDSTASAMRDKVARPLMTQLRENTVALHEQIVALGGKDLGESFFDAVRKNQGSGDKRTGKGGIELSDYFHVHGEWHETNSPDVEKWAEQIGEQYQKVIVKSIANMDMKPIAVAADGMVADTEEEIAIALAKAGSLISVGDAIEDEKLKESFEKGISKSLVAALKSIDTKNLGLTIDKSSLAGWQTAIQAMAAWTEVNTTIDNMLEPASEISVQFKSIGNQFETWKNSLEALGWQSKKINEIDKKRIEYVKKYADEVMKGFEPQNEYLKNVKEINDAFADVYKGMQDNGISQSDLNNVNSRRDAVLREYMDGILEPFRETDELKKNIQSISDTFVNAIAAMKEASDTFSEAEIDNANKLRDEAIRKTISEALAQYDAAGTSSSMLKGIVSDFTRVITAMKNASGLYTANDIANAQAKMTATMRKYVSSVTDAYKTTNNLQRQTDEINATFDDLIEGMREAGMAVKDIAAAERQRAQVLDRLRDETLNGYDQDLSLRISALNTGGTDSYSYQLLAQAYQQENERSEYEKNIGINNEQYNRLLLVQQAETLNTKIKLLQAQLRNSLQAELDNSTEMLNVANSIKSTFSSILRSLKKARQSLWTSDKNLATDRYEEAYRQFNELYARAMEGDEEALKELSSIGDTVLSLGKEQLTSRTEYNAAFYDISRKLKDAEGVASSHLDIAEKDVETQTKISDSLKNQINAVTGGTESLSATIGDLESMIQAYQKQLQSLLGIINTSIESSTRTLKDAILGLNDGTSTSRQAILETKAALMNYGEALAKGQKAGNWTSESVLKEIEKSGLTFDQWYTKYGSKELVEAAKHTGTVVKSIEDLQKITGAYEKLLEAKAKQLNDTMYSTSKVAAGGWTADLVRQEIASRGMTVAEWYDKYGKSEGFLLDTSKNLSNQTASMTKSFTSWEELLKQKADDMNKGINLAGQQAAGGWTAEKVKEEIASRGMTVKEWYEKYGKSEGYLLNTSDNTKSTSVNTNDMIKALNDYNSAQSDKILEVKAALMNMGETLGKNQKSGSNWTAESVAKAIKDSGMTMASWLSSYGGTEFANAAKKYGYTDIEKFMNDVLAGKVGTTSTSSAASTTSNSASTSSATKTNTNSSSSAANNNTNTTSSATKTNTNTTSSAVKTNTNSSSSAVKTNTNTTSSVTKTNTSSSSSTAATTASTKNTLNEKLSDLTAAQKTILENKSRAMQNGFLLGFGQAAGSQWTQQKVLDTIHAAKKTMQQWIDATWNKTEKSVWDNTLQKKSTTSTKYKTDLDLLIAKAAAMNKAKQSGKTNWNAKTAYDEIHKIMKKSTAQASLSAWYTQSGKKEGFARGGITPRNEAFWVGEEGPELVMSPQSYGVLNNKDSMDLMRSRIMAPAVEDDSLIRETNNILRQALRKIDQLEYDSHKMRQYIQKWDNDGLPATAAY